ncbi:MAG: hypothetical protein HC929_12815 [Leptolyngbyaceae cyanobacterium SM2_5_2]|nr:hypothetical protein [Leptolyngbyaceae cyanobacterium SM2_5_2]
MTRQHWPQRVGWGLLLVGLVGLPAARAMAEPSPNWYNCLTCEVFTPEKQAWCDRWQTLQNGTFIVPVGTSDTSEYIAVTLQNGEYRDPNGQFVVSLVNEPNWLAFGDIDGDGQDDAAVIFGVVPGDGTALTTYVAAVMDIDGAAQALAPVALGERLLLNSPITIENQRIIVPQLTQTEVINRAFVVDGRTLSELAQLPTPERVPSGVPDGTLVFSNTATYGVRVFTQNQQPHINLFNRATGQQVLDGVRAVAISAVEEIAYTYFGSTAAGRPPVTVTVAPDGAQTLEINNKVQTDVGTVTGTITYLPRIALPANAVVEVSLVDVSRADAPAITLASQSIITGGRQVPIPFELVYNPEQIDPRFTYAVQARISLAGQLRFINTTRVAVLTQGNPSQVEVRLTR